MTRLLYGRTHYLCFPGQLLVQVYANRRSVAITQNAISDKPQWCTRKQAAELIRAVRAALSTAGVRKGRWQPESVLVMSK